MWLQPRIKTREGLFGKLNNREILLSIGAGILLAVVLFLWQVKRLGL